MKYIFIVLFSLLSIGLFSQNVLVNGYVFEDGNRGYLNQVKINIVDKANGQSMVTVNSNLEGYFETELPANRDFVAYAQKQLFEKVEVEFNTNNVAEGDKKFIKIKMNREPGYDFEVTLAPKRDSEDIPVDAIRGAWIEVYNNTTKKEVLNLKDHPELEFNVHFDKGSHYTVMIRKEGFFTKRMEAYVNVEGCILCFEGVGSIRPGVVDNLTEGNDMGVLLTNVELDPLFSGKTFEVQNIYYDFGKATLRPEAKKALKNLALVLIDNPHILVELGSHTDSRGKTNENQALSEMRAKSAVDYLINNFDIPRKSILAAGYGESRLSNKCSDGVSCTEEEHQKNRRTEITVLNINDSKRERKTLMEIRVEEEFMKSVMEGNIETKVEGPPTESNENKGKAKEEDKNNEPKIVEVEKEQKEIVESKVTVATKNSSQKVMTKQVAKEELKISEEGEIVKEVPRKSSTISKARLEEAKAKRAKELQENKRVEKTNLDQTSQSTQNTQMNSTQKNNAKLTGGTKIVENAFLLEDYTGYKVVIQFSRFPLSKDHEMYKRHDDIIEYKASSGSVLYLIGDFETEEEANTFLNKTALMMYSAAYVIRFENGRRMK